MFKNLQRGVEFIDKPVRFLDELVHKSVDAGVKKVEEKGISREYQTFYLSLATWGASMTTPLINYMVRADSLINESLLAIFKNTYTEALVKSHNIKMQAYGLKMWYRDFPMYLPLAGSSAFDIMGGVSERSQQVNGAIHHDIYSYNSFTGVVRPYLFGTAVGYIIYGIATTDFDTAQYAATALPWILSMYTRDTGSGGLLDRVANVLREWIAVRQKSYSAG